MKRNTLRVPLKKKGTIHYNSTTAVSDVIATILLLSISLALLCVVYIMVLNNASNPSSPYQGTSSDLLASSDETHVVLQNNGGEPLKTNTKLIVTVGGTDYFVTVQDCIIDTNGDGLWSIGEQIVFTPPGIPSLFGLQIQIKLINPETNSMIMAGLVQEGAQGDFPYIQTLNPYNVWPHSATLSSYYNFIKSSYVPGKLWFEWKRTDDPSWTRTSFTNITAAPFSGYYDVTLYNLTTNKNYLFESWVQYTAGNTTVNISGGVKIFTTQIDAMGVWHFDEVSGVKALDTSGQYPSNDGFLKPNEAHGPQRMTSELNHSAKGLYLDGIDDYVEVANSNTLSITDECTIETWINRSEHSDCLIGKPLQSSLSQFGDYALGCGTPCLVHTKGTIYALVSTNENSAGFLSTIDITNTGDIIENVSTSSCLLDSFSFDSSCSNPKIIQMNAINGIFGIVYTRPSSGNRLYLKTVQIFDDGTINTPVIDTRVLDTNRSSYPDIIKIDLNTYAVVYGITAANNGVLISFTVSFDGIISPLLHKLLFGDIMIEPEIIKIEASFNNYVIIYNCIGDDGGLRTVKITNTGLLSEISYHVWFDDDDGSNPEIIYVYGNVYAIVYAGPVLKQSCILKTISILPDGTISLGRTTPPLAGAIAETTIDFIANMTVRNPHILRLFGVNNYFGISYSIDSTTSNLWGRMVTIKIQDTGNIVAISQKDCNFEPYTCAESYVIHVENELYAIVYRSTFYDGIIKTIEIGQDGHFHQDPILDMQEIGGLKCYVGDTALTSDKRYVINVYTGIDNQLVVKTAYVNTTTHTITQSFIDSLIVERGFTSSNGTFNASYSPRIIPIKNEIYAIAYCHYMSSPSFHRGKILTVQINSTGHITLLDRCTFDSNVMNTPFEFTAINRTNGFYALVYQLYSTSQGKITTLRISNAGIIVGIQDSYVFEAARCREPVMVCVYKDVYAIIYRDSLTSSQYGRLATLKIYGTNGTIKKSVLSLWQFVGSCYHPMIINVDASLFACVYTTYTSSRYITYLTTVTIATDGTITKSWIDYLEYIRRYYTNNYMAHQPEILHVDNRVYAIVSKDLPDPWDNFVYNGWITTVRIGENGDIIDSADGSTQISSSPRVTSYDMRMIPFVDEYYIVLYGGANGNLYQCVVRIPLSETSQTVFSKQGSYVIQANKTQVFVTFTDSNNQAFKLQGVLQNGWNYVVANYNRITMNLYINTNLVGSLPVNTRPLKVNANKVYFGSYNSYIDEFSIYAAVLSIPRMQQNYNYYRPI
jgi:FlaG/FlaF family flagellin (archaellin)